MEGEISIWDIIEEIRDRSTHNTKSRRKGFARMGDALSKAFEESHIEWNHPALMNAVAGYDLFSGDIYLSNSEPLEILSWQALHETYHKMNHAHLKDVIIQEARDVLEGGSEEVAISRLTNAITTAEYEAHRITAKFVQRAYGDDALSKDMITALKGKDNFTESERDNYKFYAIRLLRSARQRSAEEYHSA